MDWQYSLVWELFGRVNEKGYRQYKTCYTEIPKKNGKSELAAAIALLLLIADDESGAEVYCLDSNTRVLSSEDLRWKKLKEVKEGDRLLGFDENPLKKGSYRKWRHSKIIKKQYIKDQSYKIIFENGKEIICSQHHKWLCKPPKSSGAYWKTPKELKHGWSIRYLGAPWEEDITKDGGYLAGVYDGEGSFHSPSKKGAAFRIDFAQKVGDVLTNVINLLKIKKYKISKLRKHKTSGVSYLEIKGLYNVLRFLGEIRPVRLLKKHEEVWLGKRTFNVTDNNYLRIKEIKYIGKCELINIETSTKTFLAEGLFSHNCAAADKEQASLVFNVAAQMVRTNSHLSARLKIIDSQKRIIDHKNASVMRVLSAEAYTKHGINASGVIFDELHAQPTRDLWDVLTLGSGAARTQQLIFAITTAGYDRNSICWEQHEYAQKILNGVIEDKTFLPIIYGVDEKANWEDEKEWEKANPSLGEVITLDDMRSEYRKAKETPALQNTFRRLRLNQWTQQANRWIDITLWDENAGEINEDSLLQKECYGGLDLSSVSDLTAWVMAFPDEQDQELLRIIARFWCPEAQLFNPKNKYRDQYQVWAKQGYLKTTKGDAVDYEFVKQEVLDDAQRFALIDMNIDRLFQGHQVAMELQEEGITIAAMGMGFVSFAAPMKEFHRRLIRRKIVHGGNPILRWMIDNLAVKEDPAGNLKPDKASSQGKIDGIVSLVMALDRCMRHEHVRSKYETEKVVCY